MSSTSRPRSALGSVRKPIGGLAAAPRAPSSSVVLFDAGAGSRNALSFGFEREEFEVLAADTPEHALEIVRVVGAPVLVVSVGTDAVSRTAAVSFIGSLRDVDRRGLAVVALGRRELREELLRAGADEFVSWPAFIRDAVTLARLAMAARAEEGKGLTGLLEDYEVYFLVRALAAAARSATVELERAGQKAHIHFARGEVVTARVGRLSGVAAFHHLLLWGEASLRLRFVSPPGERKIDVPVEDLLQSGARFVEEFEQLALRVGGPQATFEKNERRFADPAVKIPAEVRGFAESMVKGSSLVDLVGMSPFKPFDTIKVCYRLCELGVVTRRDPVRTISPLTAQLAVRDWLLGTGVPAQRATVTEAGRRAAEAYAHAAEVRLHAPEDDLFAQAPFSPTETPLAAKPTVGKKTDSKKAEAKKAESKRVPKIAKVEIDEDLLHAPVVEAVPSRTEDAPTAPRESKRGPSARNKSRVDARKEAPHYEGAKPVNRKETGKVPRVVVAEAPPKEPVFDEVDEAFFAGEAELHKIEAVDDFSDLDQTGRARKLSSKRSWLSDDKSKPHKKR